MFIYSSRYPDRSEWQNEENYRYDVRNDLFLSAVEIESDENRVRACFNAYERLAKYDDVPVSAFPNCFEQHLHLRA